MTITPKLDALDPKALAAGRKRLERMIAFLERLERGEHRAGFLGASASVAEPPAAEAPLPDVGGEPETFAWLVESFSGQHDNYLSGFEEAYAGQGFAWFPTWTADHAKAMRFAREIDAATIARNLSPTTRSKAVEHGWIAKPVASDVGGEPRGEAVAWRALLEQVKRDYASALETIVRLQGGDPRALTEWQRWTPQAHTLAMIDKALADATPPAQPAREVAVLREWKQSIIGLCKALGSDDMPWGGDKTGWGFIFYFVKHLHTRAIAAEAALRQPAVVQGATELLRAIVATTHRPNPQDQSRIDVAPGQHRAFQDAIEAATAALASPRPKGETL